MQSAGGFDRDISVGRSDLKSVSAVHLLLLACIFLMATGLRLYHLDKPSFWFDEAGSVVTACGHWERLFDHVTGYFEPAPDLASPTGKLPLRSVWEEGDAHPPLYYFLLRGWWFFFGMSEASCRAMSVIASLLGIVVLFDVARLITGPTAALWACAIMAVSPPQVEYAQEARSYALVVLFGLGTCDAILRIVLLGANRWRFAALGLFAFAAAMTHYFVIGALLGVVAFAAIFLRGRVRLIAISIVLAACTITLTRVPIILRNLDKTHISIQWLAEPREGLIGRTFVRVATLPTWLLIRPLDQDMAFGACGVLLLILPFFFNRKRPGLLLAGLWSCGIIGMVAANDLVLARNALLYIRYTLAASPMVFISFVAIADLGGRWCRHLMPVIALAGAVLALPDMYQSIPNRKTEVRELCDDIRDHVRAGDVLIISSVPDRGLYSASMEYDEIAFYAWPIPCPVAILESPASENVLRQIDSHHRIWAVNCWGSAGAGDPMRDYQISDTYRMRYQVGQLRRVEPKLALTHE